MVWIETEHGLQFKLFGAELLATYTRVFLLVATGTVASIKFQLRDLL